MLKQFAALAPLGMLMVACTSIPEGRYALSSIDFSGNDELDDDEVEAAIASRETPEFLGVFPGVIYEYAVFDRYVLERDLQRIERYYRARGFYHARVRAGQVFYTGDRHTHVEILIDEGPPVQIARIDLYGLEGLPEAERDAAYASVRAVLSEGDRFEEEAFEAAEEALGRALGDEGYALVEVERSADVDLARNLASLGFWVKPGEPKQFGEVAIVGLGPIAEAPVRRALDIQPGDPYSRSELEEAELALLELGVFSYASVEADLEQKVDGPRVPIIARVEVARLRSVHLGVGALIDTIQTDLHLVAGWESRNFLGGMRSFLVEAVPGVVLHPTRLPGFEPPQRLLPKARVRMEFRQPGFIEARTNALVRSQANMYPVLFAGDRPEGQPILGYREVRGAVGLDRVLWKFYGALTQNVQLSSPFAYAGDLDPALSTVLVSYPELQGTLELRDNPMDPHAGAYLDGKLQVAGVGGDARDLKTEVDGRVYIPLRRRVSLALRGNVGLLFAQNYGQTVGPNALVGEPGPGVSRSEWVRDIQIMFFRGFFAGGPGSNRGYALREIGPHGVVPFFNPGQSTGDLQTLCSPTSAQYDPSQCNLPLGGFTMWSASLELRFPLGGPLTAAVFTDAADVSPNEVSFRLDRPHLSAGLGLRYGTPVGPVRFDVGYRIPGLQAPPSPEEGVPDDILGLPIAASIGIGQAF